MLKLNKFLIILAFFIISLNNLFSEKIELTEYEREYLNNLGTITMAVDNDWMPFEYVDEKGNFTGIVGDLIALIEERLDIKIELVPTRDWKETLEYSKAGKVHIIPFLNQTEERDKWLIFTEPLFEDANVLITRQEHPFIGDLALQENKTMVLPKGTSIEERVKRDYPNINIITTNTEKEAFDLLINGKAHMTLRSLTISAYTIRKENLFNLKVAGRVKDYTNYLRIGVLKDYEMLRDILNKGVESISIQEKEGLISKHVYIKVEEINNYAMAKRILLFSLIVALILLYINYVQKVEADKKKKILISLKESEEKYKLLFENSAEAIIVISENKIKIANPMFYYLAAYEKEELEKMIFIELVYEEDIHRVLAFYKERLKGNKNNIPYQFRIINKNKKVIWIESRGVVIDWEGKPSTLNFIIDINDKKLAEEEIIYLSYHDKLTNLYNRRFFETELRRLDIKRNFPISIVVIDVNGLKLTNDIFGHSAGDKLIQKTGEVLMKECRDDEIICRIGGDEFAILLPRTANEEAEKIVSRIKSSIKLIEINYVKLSMSFGIATKNFVDESIEATFMEADNNMYDEKAKEKSKVRKENFALIKKYVESKIEYEKIHSHGVREMALSIGKELNLSNDELLKLEQASLLHNIGKISVSKEILDKHSILNENEWKDIKKHPQNSATILGSVPELVPISEIVLSHHENWDGKGYPQGLKREEIPLLSRIISISDSYFAMISERPYRKKLEKNEAIKIIGEESGKKFDPQIVEVFLKIYA